MKSRVLLALVVLPLVAACGSAGETPDDHQAATDAVSSGPSPSRRCENSSLDPRRQRAKLVEVAGTSNYGFGLPPTYPRKAVAHVVTYRHWRGFGDKKGDVFTIIRRGAMLRLELLPVWRTPR